MAGLPGTTWKRPVNSVSINPGRMACMVTGSLSAHGIQRRQHAPPH